MSKKQAYILFLLVLTSIIAHAEIENFNRDSKSKVRLGSQIANLDEEQVINLALVGKIWGFLKYHHPIVAIGNVNWDSVLFRIVPQVLEANNQSKRDKIIEKWIDDVGSFPSTKVQDCAIESDYKQIPDYAWINTQYMNAQIVKKLLDIKAHRNTEKNHYVSVWENEAPPLFTNELAYDTSNYPNLEIRLLCLYRFWNIIQYYYPYKYTITEKNWNEVISEMIPKFANAQNAGEYRNAILSLLESIHDSHTVLYKDPIALKVNGVYKPKIRIKFIENKPVVVKVSNKDSKLLVGDIIVQKQGEDLDSVINRMIPLTPASNNAAKFRDISTKLLSSNEKLIHIQVLRNDTLIDVTEPAVSYYNDVLSSIPKYNNMLLAENIGYIYLGNIKANQFQKIFEQFKETKGIIIDLRNYPQLLVDELLELGEYLMPHSVEYAKFSNTSVTCTGLFHYDEPRKIGKEQTEYYKGIVAILVNEITQSKAELFVMALSQAPEAVVIGSTTAGADGPVITFPLPGGYETGIAGRGVYYPNGKETQRIGIVPNIEIKPTINGIKENRDELMDKAIEYITNN
jgi:Peptidase family S41